MKTLLIILSFLFTTSVYSQVGIGHSFAFWGKTIETAEISYQVDRFSLHYFHNYSKDTYINEFGLKDKLTSPIAIGIRLINKKNIALGTIVTTTPFPTKLSTYANFLVEIKIPLNRFELKYRHISNGFGLIHPVNHGYDSISLYIKL